MLDRLLYRSSWFDLPNQRPLEECYWQGHRRKRPVVGVSGKRLRADDYACDWKIEGRKLWLLSTVLEEDGSELLPRIAPGDTAPMLAEWHTGILDANGQSFVKRTAEVHDESVVIPIVRFHVECGSIVLTEHFNHSPQFGWRHDEPSLRLRDDWKASPE